jgi:N-acetylmuramoyl-L-alanine amidase
MVSASEDSGANIVAGDLPWSGSLPRRELAEITAVVLHATETLDLAAAREIAMQSVGQDGVGLCGHLYIDRDGTCARFVALNRIANHVRGHNRRTIGIELVNVSRYPHHFDSRHQEPTEPFPDQQMAALEQCWPGSGVPARISQRSAGAPHPDNSIVRSGRPDPPK